MAEGDLARSSSAVTLSHSTDFDLSLLVRKSTGSSETVSLSCIIMITAAVGAIALTVAALPAFDRFFGW